MIPFGLPVLASPNAGLPRRVDERMVYVSTPEYFGVYARRMIRMGVRLVGGCCGTTPEHIRRIAAAARMASATGDAEGFAVKREDDASNADSRTPALGVSIPGSMHPPPLAERSQLAAKIAAGRVVVSVEAIPPAPSRRLRCSATAASTWSTSPTARAHRPA